MADLRRCIGSTRFGIEPHEAAVEDFPKQPSQKDGLGRMCRRHWNEYTTALRKAAVARKGADGGVATQGAPTESIRTPATRGRREAEADAEVAQEPTAG